MSTSIPLQVTPSAFSGLIGVGRRDTTPPDGIYARMWGAASHDLATGVHRPLSTTALALQSAGGRPRLLVALDIALLGDLGGASDAERVLGPVREALSLEPGRLLVNCSHTHAAPWAAMSRSHNPGGELIGPYLDQLSTAILEAGREAIDALAPATLTWATGSCDLARNRDLPDPASESGRFICGFNPTADADDTLVVGRVTADARRTRGRHDRQLRLPPDDARVGQHAHLAGLHRGDARDRRVADGRRAVRLPPGSVGRARPRAPVRRRSRLSRTSTAAGSATARWPRSRGCSPPARRSATTAPVESGAPLAVWLPAPFEPSETLDGGLVDVPLPVKPLPPLEELEAQHAAAEDRPMKERLFRKIQIVRNLGGGDHEVSPAWVWRVGDSLLVAHANEAYSCFQEDLRAAFPDATVVVMNTSGAEVGYLYPPELEGLDLYQVWQTPFSKDALPTLTETCIGEGRRLFAS